MITISVLAVLAAFLTWITVDLKIGFKQHRSNISPMKGNVTRQSGLKFFAHGDKMFAHMMETIEQAEKHIHIQFFIFRDDSFGQKFLNLLKKKVREGVTVRLLVDWGGYHISMKEKKALKEAGVQLYKTNTPSFPLLFYSINERNHRKVTVVDGQYGYIGGYNVGDEYLGRDPEMGRWRDYHLYVEGEANMDLQESFIVDWNSASGEALQISDVSANELKSGSVPVKVIVTEGAHVVDALHQLLNKAKKSVFIGTPYFIPGDSLKNKLIELSKKGIQIKLLVPKYPDHPLVKDAAYPYFPELLEAGVEIRQFYEGFYHSKVLIVDDYLIDIGTSNFDKRSFHINKEINCIIEDPGWVAPVKEEIEKDFHESAENITIEHVNSRSAFEKGKEKIATLISPFL